MNDNDKRLVNEWLADLFSHALAYGADGWAEVVQYDGNTCRAVLISTEVELGDLVPAAKAAECLYQPSWPHGADPVPAVRFSANLATIRRGLKLGASRTQAENHHHWQCNCGRPPLVLTAGAIDEWDYDALDASAVLQLGLFGEVLFG